MRKLTQIQKRAITKGRSLKNPPSGRKMRKSRRKTLSSSLMSSRHGARISKSSSRRRLSFQRSRSHHRKRRTLSQCLKMRQINRKTLLQLIPMSSLLHSLLLKSCSHLQVKGRCLRSRSRRLPKSIVSLIIFLITHNQMIPPHFLNCNQMRRRNQAKPQKRSPRLLMPVGVMISRSINCDCIYICFITITH